MPRSRAEHHIEFVQRADQAARHYAGIGKQGGTHTLRDYFAIYLLDGKADWMKLSMCLTPTWCSRCLTASTPCADTIRAG